MDIVENKFSAGKLVGDIFRDIFRNLKTAIYLSRGLIIVMALSILASLLVGVDMGDEASMKTAKGAIFMIVYILVLIYPATSTAISWHRFIIKGEMTTKMFNSIGICLRYFGWGILIGVIILFSILLISVPSMIVAPFLKLIVIIPILFFCYVMLLSYRLSLKLPSIALDATPLTLKECFDKTKGSTWFFLRTFLLMILVGILLAIALAIIGIIVGFISSFIGLNLLHFLVLGAVNLAYYWFTSMMYISLLTNIYKRFGQ